MYPKNVSEVFVTNIFVGAKSYKYENGTESVVS